MQQMTCGAGTNQMRIKHHNKKMITIVIITILMMTIFMMSSLKSSKQKSNNSSIKFSLSREKMFYKKTFQNDK